MSFFKSENQISILRGNQCTMNDINYPLEFSSTCGCMIESKIYCGSSSGKIYILSPNKRVESTIDGHNGMVTLCVVFNDTIITTGEDGLAKMWSLTGSLRATIARSQLPIHASCIIKNDFIYACRDKIIVNDVYGSSSKRIYNTDSIITSICPFSKGLLVGGQFGKLQLYSNYKLLKFVQFNSKIYKIHVNEHLGLIYCGFASKLYILDFKLVILKKIECVGTVIDVVALNNGQIHVMTTLSTEKFHYFPALLKHSFAVFFQSKFIIENIKLNTQYTVDVLLQDILEIVINRAVFVILKNKVIVYDQKDIVIDVSFTIKRFMAQNWYFLLM